MPHTVYVVCVVVKNYIQVKIKFLCLLTFIRVRRQRKLRIKLVKIIFT